MEHSGPPPADRQSAGAIAGPSAAPGAVPRLPLPARIGLTLLDALARLSVPASVLLLSRGATRVAAAASAVALVATIGRGFAVSFAVERALRATFEAVVAAAVRLSLVDLRAERKIGVLTEAAREEAAYQATVAPALFAYGLAIAATWAALLSVLGPLWALALLAAAGPLVAALGLAARRIRAQQEVAWSAFSDVAIDLRVLVEACVELRAHDREPGFSRGLVERARSFARAERRASVWSAATGAAPAALVFVSASAFGGTIAAIVEGATGRRAAEMGVVAGAAMYFAVGFGKLLEHRARLAPFRGSLRAFLASAGRAAPRPEGGSGADLPSLLSATIRFRGVSVRHPGAPRATPARVEHAWEPGRGLFFAGENGAGKSSLALALLGLVTPSEGTIEIGGARLDGARARELRRRCAYLAQSPFVEPGASVAWHLRLFSEAPIDDARVDEALRRVGLYPVLLDHASRDGAGLSPRDVPAGELSGGERQRMHLARLLAQGAELLVLDEPEAGLDHEARAEVAALLEELARERRILLIAHDPTIVPSSFERLDIHAEPRIIGVDFVRDRP